MGESERDREGKIEKDGERGFTTEPFAPEQPGQKWQFQTQRFAAKRVSQFIFDIAVLAKSSNSHHIWRVARAGVNFTRNWSNQIKFPLMTCNGSAGWGGVKIGWPQKIRLLFFMNIQPLKIDQLLTTHRSPSTRDRAPLQTS